MPSESRKRCRRVFCLTRTVTSITQWSSAGADWGPAGLFRPLRFTSGRTGTPSLSLTKPAYSQSVFPLDKADPVITKICGWQSGHNIDKVKEAGLTLEDPQANGVSGVKEYPLTLECRVLYSQCQDPTRLPESIYKKSYPQDVDGSYPMANRDPHTAYIGEIVAAYIIH